MSEAAYTTCGQADIDWLAGTSPHNIPLAQRMRDAIIKFCEPEVGSLVTSGIENWQRAGMICRLGPGCPVDCTLVADGKAGTEEGAGLKTDGYMVYGLTGGKEPWQTVWMPDLALWSHRFVVRIEPRVMDGLMKGRFETSDVLETQVDLEKLAALLEHYDLLVGLEAIPIAGIHETAYMYLLLPMAKS